MKTTNERIAAFCKRHGLTCEWQELKLDGRRAVIRIEEDRQKYEAVLGAARRLKGVKVDTWVHYGGIWEGIIALQDADMAAQIEAALKAESERVEQWWQTYHEYLTKGLGPNAAAITAERMYPTPGLTKASA